MKNSKLFYATIIGNIVEHYDKTLFGLIAPFVAPLFFPSSDPIVALILIYLPIGWLMRPLGALYWGYVGDRKGRKKALYFSILGMSLIILMMGFLPTYETWGILSACLLHFQRGLVSFFAAGEGPSASLVLIENTTEKSKDLVSSYYEMSSILGVLMASLIVTALCLQGKVLDYWRWLFILSGLIGLLGSWMRKEIFISKEIDPIENSSQRVSLKELIRSHGLPFLAIFFVTGFSCANYHIVTKLMNSYLPLVTSLSTNEVMATHCLLILYDLFLLPLFGWISKQIGKEKLIIGALFSAAFGVFPLFKLLEHPTLWNVLFLRFMLVTWGIALAAPFNFWAISLIQKEVRFRVLALSRAFGAQWIGGSSISLSLFIYHKTHWRAAPACIVFATAFLSLCGIGALKRFSQKRKLAFSDAP